MNDSLACFQNMMCNREQHTHTQVKMLFATLIHIQAMPELVLKIFYLSYYQHSHTYADESSMFFLINTMTILTCIVFIILNFYKMYWYIFEYYNIIGGIFYPYARIINNLLFSAIIIDFINMMTNIIWLFYQPPAQLQGQLVGPVVAWNAPMKRIYYFFGLNVFVGNSYIENENEYKLLYLLLAMCLTTMLIICFLLKIFENVGNSVEDEYVVYRYCLNKEKKSICYHTFYQYCLMITCIMTISLLMFPFTSIIFLLTVIVDIKCEKRNKFYAKNRKFYQIMFDFLIDSNNLSQLNDKLVLSHIRQSVIVDEYCHDKFKSYCDYWPYAKNIVSKINQHNGNLNMIDIYTIFECPNIVWFHTHCIKNGDKLKSNINIMLTILENINFGSIITYVSSQIRLVSPFVDRDTFVCSMCLLYVPLFYLGQYSDMAQRKAESQRFRAVATGNRNNHDNDNIEVIIFIWIVMIGILIFLPCIRRSIGDIIRLNDKNIFVVASICNTHFVNHPNFIRTSLHDISIQCYNYRTRITCSIKILLLRLILAILQDSINFIICLCNLTMHLCFEMIQFGSQSRKKIVAFYDHKKRKYKQKYEYKNDYNFYKFGSVLLLDWFIPQCCQLSKSRITFLHISFNNIITGIKIYAHAHKQKKQKKQKIEISTFDFCYNKKYNQYNNSNKVDFENKVWFPITYSHIQQNNMDTLKRFHAYLTVNDNNFNIDNKYIYGYNIIPGFGIYTFTMCCLFYFVYKPFNKISRCLMIYFIYLLFGLLLTAICLYLYLVSLSIGLPFIFLIQLYYHCDTSLIVFSYHLHIVLTSMYIVGILSISFLYFGKIFYLIYSQIHFCCYFRQDKLYEIPYILGEHIVNTYNNSIERDIIIENSFLGKDLTTIVLKYLPKFSISENEMKQIKNTINAI